MLGAGVEGDGHRRATGSQACRAQRDCLHTQCVPSRSANTQQALLLFWGCFITAGLVDKEWSPPELLQKAPCGHGVFQN